MLFSKKLKEKDKEIDSLTNLANKLMKERTVINIVAGSRGNCKSDWLINEIYKKLNDGETIAIINKNGEKTYIRKCGRSH